MTEKRNVEGGLMGPAWVKATESAIVHQRVFTKGPKGVPDYGGCIATEMSPEVRQEMPQAQRERCLMGMVVW